MTADDLPRDTIISILPSGSSSFTILQSKENPPQEDGSQGSPFHFEAVNTTDIPPTLVDDFKPALNSDWLGRHSDLSKPIRRHVIISTGSGTGLASEVWKELVKPLLDHVDLVENDQYEVHSTTSETSVSELTQSVILPQANSGTRQSILLLSGDGGIVDLVNTLLSAVHSAEYIKPSITLLPLGSGNALANSTGITGDKTLGLRTMSSGSPKQIPLFRATFSPGARLLVSEGREERRMAPAAHGAVVCSWGHHATLVADSDTVEYRRQFGTERFKMAAKEALFPSDGSAPHAYQGRVSVRRPDRTDWEVLPRQEHGYILATFVQQLEAGFTISPASKPLDGKLRLVHFGDLDGKEAMDVMGKAFGGGKHVEDENVGYEEIRGLRIDFDEDEARWRRVCVDGKIIRVEKGGWLEVVPISEGVVDLVAR